MLQSPRDTSGQPPIMLWLVMCIFTLTVLRGLRFPNLWAYTHFLFDYELGFSRRALWGGLFSQFSSS